MSAPSNDIQNIVATHRGESPDRLLIYFSSAGSKRIQGVSKFTPYGQTTIFVRDPRRGWYNLPIKGLSHDADELAAQIEMRIGGYDRANITMSGSSMGGYAALLFGSMLGVGRIVAVAPQIILRSELTHCPKEPAKYDDITNIVHGAPSRTKIDIWYGAESFLDLYNVLRIRPSANTTLHPVPGAMHNVLAVFKRKDRMEDFFEHVSTGKPFSYDTGSVTHHSEILAAGDAFYSQRDYRKAIDILAPISDEASLSAVDFLIGDSHLKVGDLTSARTFLERAAANSPENYDANYYLGLVLDKMGKTKAAAGAYSRSLDHFPSPNGVRLFKLAVVQKKLGLIDLAVSNYKRALELDKRLTKAHFEIGAILMKQGDLANALEHFERHSAANPDFGGSLRAVKSLRNRLKAKLPFS